MQKTTTRPVGQVATSRKSSSNSGPKTQHKKKKSQQPSKSNKEGTGGPRSVAPSPVSGPWVKLQAAANSPPGFTSSLPATGFSDAQVRLLRHRALFAFRFLVGKAVELQLVASDERYAGILDCVDPDDFSVVLKNVKRLSSGIDAKPFVDGSTVIFGRHQLAHLTADGMVNYRDGVFASGTSAVSSGFQTDTEISGQKEKHLFGRELEAASSWLDPALDTGALEDSVPNSRRHSKNQGQAGWNQFEANEKLFGVVSSYDENIYTTKLDKSKISTEQSRAAEKLAQEIEQQSAAGNFHLQEERGQTVRGGKHLDDMDEEARYSSVDRRAPASCGGNTYVPPALRKAQRQCSPDKSQAKMTKTVSAIAPIVAAIPSSPTLKSAPGTASTASASIVNSPIAPKPLSFSEAVTGRSAVDATPEVMPTAALEGQPEEMKGVAFPPIAETSAQVDRKNSNLASAKSKGISSKKKDAANGNEKRIESKAESKTDSASSATSSLSTTKLAKSETPPKKGLNPKAKEFKLSASAAEFTPSFAVAPAVSSPYCGNSPVHMPYPHPGMGYPPPVQEEWMYDGVMGGEESGEMGLPPYMQSGYSVPMGLNGIPMMYPPMMLQQNMRGNYAGYQQQGYNPRAYYSPPNGGHPGTDVPYMGDSAMPGGVGPQPPLPPTPTCAESPSESSADVTPPSSAPKTAPEVESTPARSKQTTSASKKK